MKAARTQHTGYQIRVVGHLPLAWADWFEGTAITLESDGTTLITGLNIDQAALHGILKKIRDTGLPLISVAQLNSKESYSNVLPGEKMEITSNIVKKIDTRTLLSILWVVVMINMLKADILSLFIPGAAEEVARTSASTGTPIPILMLGGAIMMELSIAMIILSRVLPYGVSRWANIVISILTIVFVIRGGVNYPHYIFIASIEVACLLVIVWKAWTWRNPQYEPQNQPVEGN